MWVTKFRIFLISILFRIIWSCIRKRQDFRKSFILYTKSSESTSEHSKRRQHSKKNSAYKLIGTKRKCNRKVTLKVTLLVKTNLQSTQQALHEMTDASNCSPHMCTKSIINAGGCDVAGRILDKNVSCWNSRQAERRWSEGRLITAGLRLHHRAVRLGLRCGVPFGVPFGVLLVDGFEALDLRTDPTHLLAVLNFGAAAEGLTP